MYLGFCNLWSINVVQTTCDKFKILGFCDLISKVLVEVRKASQENWLIEAQAPLCTPNKQLYKIELMYYSWIWNLKLESQVAELIWVQATEWLMPMLTAHVLCYNCNCLNRA